MFREMRAALAIPKTIDILEHIRSLSDKPDHPPPTDKATSTTDATTPKSQCQISSPRSRAISAIQAIESHAMTQQTPQPGLNDLMTYLHTHDVKKALCTRNFPAPVHHLLDKYVSGEEGRFWPLVTRDTVGVRAKPSPEGVWVAVRGWRVGMGQREMGYAEFLKAADAESDARLGRSTETSEMNAADSSTTLNSMADNTNPSQPSDSNPIDSNLNPSPGIEQNDKSTDPLHLINSLSKHTIMVGDSIDDLTAGHRAGAATVLLVNEENAHLKEHEFTDLCIERLGDLIGVLEGGFVGKG